MQFLGVNFLQEVIYYNIALVHSSDTLNFEGFDFLL